MQKGPSKGLWLWALDWDKNPSTMSGKSATLPEALALIKSRHQASGEAS